MAKLTDLETRMLDFAESSRSLEHVRTEFGWRPVTFVMQLRALVERVDVEAERPRTARLIRARLDRNAQQRASRTFQSQSA